MRSTTARSRTPLCRLLPLLGLLLVPLGGCSSIQALHRSDHGAPLVFGGTRLNIDALGPRRHEPGIEPAYAALDLPFSAILDTVLLPFTVGAALSRAVMGESGR